MPSTLTVGKVSAKPGETKYGPAYSVELKDGTAVNLPVILVNGAKDGPTITITAAVHPTELIGTEAIRRVTRKLVKAKDLKGKIIAFPLTNPLAAQFGVYVSPHDGVNMSVAFPGSMTSGSATQRLANFVWENATTKSDLAIDFHENVKPCLHFTIVGYSDPIPGSGFKPDKKAEQVALDASEAFGMTTIRPGEGKFNLPGMFAGARSYSRVCLDHGIPAMTPEFEGAYDLKFSNETTIEVAVRGLMNTLKHMGMISGKLEKQKGILVLGDAKAKYTFRGMTKANRGGIVHRLVDTGVELSEGTPIAEIYNSYGDVLETIKMPMDGYVWGWTLRDWMVQEGGTVSFIFTENK